MQPLTENQLSQYKQQGYVILGQVLDASDLAGLRDEEARVREFEPYEPNTTIFRSQLARYSAVIRDVIEYADPNGGYRRPPDTKTTPIIEVPDTWLVAGQMDWPKKR